MTPFFILAFLSASIILAFFIHRAQTGPSGSLANKSMKGIDSRIDQRIDERVPASSGMADSDSSRENIEEIPKEWIRE